jgi:hypothetical protein
MSLSDSSASTLAIISSLNFEIWLVVKADESDRKGGLSYRPETTKQSWKQMQTEIKRRDPSRAAQDKPLA